MNGGSLHSNEPDTDWDRRLKNAKASAEYGEEGDVSFLQVQRTPLVSLFITTGCIIDNQKKRKDVHLRFVNQPSYFPSLIETNEAMETRGYEKFQSLVRNLSDSRKYKNEYLSYTKYKYNEMFYGVCSDIDNSIREYHAVVCYRDGDDNNKKNTNRFFLHICDIMVSIIGTIKGYTPSISIKTLLMNNLEGMYIVNDFYRRHLAKERLDFFITHIDFLYVVYCYHSNNSFVPIRLGISKHSHVFKEASFFMNDSFFVEHQKGKLCEFNQNEEKIHSRVMYRSI